MVLIYSTIIYHLYLLPGLLIINVCDTMYFDPMNKCKNKNKKLICSLIGKFSVTPHLFSSLISFLMHLKRVCIRKRKRHNYKKL